MKARLRKKLCRKEFSLWLTEFWYLLKPGVTIEQEQEFFNDLISSLEINGFLSYHLSTSEQETLVEKGAFEATACECNGCRHSNLYKPSTYAKDLILEFIKDNNKILDQVSFDKITTLHKKYK